MFQYWGALAHFLTKLKLAFDEDITFETSSALSQLAQLKGLLLAGFGENVATIHLQLPQLAKLSLHGFGDVNVVLECPQLTNFKVTEVQSFPAMGGLPGGIEKLKLEWGGNGAMALEQMLPFQGFKHLSELFLHGCPGQPATLRETYIPSNLISLSASEAWVPLLPTQPPWQGLPCNLRYVLLWLPLDNGIPLVLEQLSALVSLELHHVGAGPMHLTRPLDPFLDIDSLKRLDLCTSEDWPEGVGLYTPAALGFLGAAERRVGRMQRVTGRIINFQS